MMHVGWIAALVVASAVCGCGPRLLVDDEDSGDESSATDDDAASTTGEMPPSTTSPATATTTSSTSGDPPEPPDPTEPPDPPPSCNDPSDDACLSCAGDYCCAELEECFADEACECLVLCVLGSDLPQFEAVDICQDECGSDQLPAEVIPLHQCTTMHCPECS
jgi:hypothetical protein